MTNIDEIITQVRVAQAEINQAKTALEQSEAWLVEVSNDVRKTDVTTLCLVEALSFIQELTNALGRYKYLAGTLVVADANKFLKRVERLSKND